MNMKTRQVSIQAGFRYLLILSLVIVAFILRFEHLLARVFHIDEYISMLAAQMTAQKGAPILPSGLLYDHGLLISYLTAPFLRLLGFSEEIARWPSVLVGVVTVASFYLVATKLFKSQAAGLFALTFATFDTAMIVWSGRMRMYALAIFLMLLALYFLAQGTFLHPHRRYRLAAAGCYLGATLTHSVSVVILPVWGLAAIICVGLGHKKFNLNWYRQKSFRLEILIVLLLLALGVGFSLVGQIPFLSPAAADTGGGGGGVIGVLRKFLEPGVSWERVDDFFYYYVSPDYWLLTVLGGLAFLRALASVIRGRFTRRDLATLFLGLVFYLTIAELALALTHTWRKTRYLFILCQPSFLLLAADGLARLGEPLSILFRKRAEPMTLVGTLLGIVGILGLWGGPAIAAANIQGTGGYDTAFMWVREHWQEGDRVMTVHPSASYLYLGRSDYYATQGTARVLLDDESEEVVDRYVGSQLLDSVEALNQVLSEKGRLWFVVDTNRLVSRYDPLFTQQVFAQMDVIYRAGEVLVFLSRPYPQPVPAEPSVVVDAKFGDLIELGGYSLDLGTIAPDGSVQLGLYWRPLGGQFTRVYKVFVQLRNEQDQMVAQADHYMLEGFLTGSIMAQLRDQNQWLRDTADLNLPQGLPSGTYRLLVGLYDPDTLERVPVVADQSGENAVILETVSVP
jgi:4-amino-4-deoxy-L-arabinose transferase-like glycosyltransferase